MVNVQIHSHEGLASKAWQYSVPIELHMLPSKPHSQHNALALLRCKVCMVVQHASETTLQLLHKSTTEPLLTAMAPTAIAYALSNESSITEQTVVGPVLGRACS